MRCRAFHTVGLVITVRTLLIEFCCHRINKVCILFSQLVNLVAPISHTAIHVIETCVKIISETQMDLDGSLTALSEPVYTDFSAHSDSIIRGPAVLKHRSQNSCWVQQCIRLYLSRQRSHFNFEKKNAPD